MGAPRLRDLELAQMVADLLLALDGRPQGEIEREPALALWLAHLPNVNVQPFRIDQESFEEVSTVEEFQDLGVAVAMDLAAGDFDGDKCADEGHGEGGRSEEVGVSGSAERGISNQTQLSLSKLLDLGSNFCPMVHVHPALMKSKP